MHAEEYWDGRYSSIEGIRHHSVQNYQISRDFLQRARARWMFNQAFSGKKVIEIGCGTGDFGFALNRTHPLQFYVGTDLSKWAIEIANKRFPSLMWRQMNVLTDTFTEYFDTAIASNTLEHFKDPHEVIRRMLLLAPTVIVIVPYCQPVTDGYEEEGGAGHAFKFKKSTFYPYDVLDSFMFKTNGWQHSSAGEEPQQLAVLLNAKT